MPARSCHIQNTTTTATTMSRAKYDGQK